MKICPFISHMIGDEGTEVLEASSRHAAAKSMEDSDVVILGYDDDGGQVGVKSRTRSKSKSKTKSKAKSDDTSPLFCLKDTCRFYQKTGDACMFDRIFETVETTANETDMPKRRLEDDKTASLVSKELDKFWKFQTKSVAELISSVGEAEKKQSDAVDKLRRDLEERLKGMPTNRDGIGSKDLEKIEKALTGLRESDLEKIERAVAGVRDRDLEKIEIAIAGLQDRDLQIIDRKITSLREKEMEDLEQSMAGMHAHVLENLEKTNSNMHEQVLESLAKSNSGMHEKLLESLSQFSSSASDRDFRALERAIGEMHARVLEGIEHSNTGPGKEELQGIEKAIDTIRESIDSREDGMENFTTTVSELVVNIQDSLTGLSDQADAITARLEKLERSPADAGDLERSVEKAIERQMGNMSAPDASDEFKSLAGQVKEFVATNARFERKLEEWQQKIEERVQEIHGNQESWSTRFDEIDKRQSDVIDMIGTMIRTPVEETPKSGKARRGERRGNQDARKLNNLGVTSFHHGELEMAREQFLQAVDLDDEFAEAYNNLGLVYTEMEQSKEAAAAFSRAIEINPDLHAAYNNLGYAFYRQGNYEQAVEMYTEALDRSARSSSAYTNLGNAYYKLDRKDEAREAWEKALELDPGNEKASRNIKRLERE